MKKKLITAVVSVMMLLCLTVNAMAIRIGTTEWDKPVGCQTSKKVIVAGSNGKQVKTLRKLTSAHFDGTHPVRLSYSSSYSGSITINGAVPAAIKYNVSAKTSVQYSWTKAEVAGYTWNIGKGNKVGTYSMVYRQKLDKYPYRYYTRTATLFETGSWLLRSSGTILDRGTNCPYFALIYTAD